MVLNQALIRLGHDVRMTGNAATLWRWVAEGEGDLVIIPAGTATRFEPGQSREVRLVAYAGGRRVVGFNGRINGKLG